MMNKLSILLAAFGSLTVGSAANATVVIPIGTLPPAAAFFYATYETPTFSIVNANFGDTVQGGNTAIDDKFTFTLPLAGGGSGSVSTSFSSPSTLLTITNVKVNGTDYTPAQAAMGITGVPITAFALNTIEIFGMTGPSTQAGTFTGTATFTAAAVPEPTIWATFLLGFGLIGIAVRRKFALNVKAAQL